MLGFWPTVCWWESLASIPFDAKHQIILPKNDHVSNLIVEHCHHISRYSGKEHVISLLCEQFCIVMAGSAVKTVMSRCVSCWQHQSYECEQKMADLPEDCLTMDQPPFTSGGVDYFGPFKYGIVEASLRDMGSFSLVSRFKPCTWILFC